ncbi:Snl1p [Sporobolomyces salmoneus]|uniref:Snl1p n=1 Tax=Sporobolomyces salmoneus TaxID=183962 RepID=UPI00316F1C3E
MPMFNTSNPFSSNGSSGSSSQASSRRSSPKKQQSQPPPESPATPAPPPPDPRLVSLSQLDSATQRLLNLRKSFVLPSRLTFQPTSTPESPKLDYASNNKPFHAYEEALTKLLIELDGIDSCGGDMDIRTRRKNLVVEIERELAGLDEIKRREYRRQHESAGMSRREEQGARTVDENRQQPHVRGGQGMANNGSPLPPGIPLPPRDYPQSRAPGSHPHQAPNRYQPNQARGSRTPSPARRPPRHATPSPNRSPHARRHASPAPRPASPARNPWVQNL